MKKTFEKHGGILVSIQLKHEHPSFEEVFKSRLDYFVQIANPYQLLNPDLKVAVLQDRAVSSSGETIAIAFKGMPMRKVLVLLLVELLLPILCFRFRTDLPSSLLLHLWQIEIKPNTAILYQSSGNCRTCCRLY